MKRVLGARASTILYNTLTANKARIGKGCFLLPANVCPIVPITFLNAGVDFNFVDINPETQSMDMDIAYSYLLAKKKIAGLLFVHSYGFKQNIQGFFKQLRIVLPELILIDDQCICIPDIHGKSVVPGSDLTLFSTGYAKFVEFGEGGFGFLSKETLYREYDGEFSEIDHDQLVKEMNLSIQNNMPFVYHDTNWLRRKHNFSEAEYFKNIELKIPIVKNHKENINAIYADNIPEEIQMNTKYWLWRCNLQVKDKAKLLQKIFDAGLFASSHYTSVSNIFSASKSPVADNYHHHMVNLFNDHRISEEVALQLCDIVKINYK